MTKEAAPITRATIKKEMQDSIELGKFRAWFENIMLLFPELLEEIANQDDDVLIWNLVIGRQIPTENDQDKLALKVFLLFSKRNLAKRLL